MLKLNTSTQFKKDYKTCIKRHYKMDLMQAVVDVLRVPDALPQKNRDHSLTGNYTGCHECHIQPDWILIYRQTDTELYLVATGTLSNNADFQVDFLCFLTGSCLGFFVLQYAAKQKRHADPLETSVPFCFVSVI